MIIILIKSSRRLFINYYECNYMYNERISQFFLFNQGVILSFYVLVEIFTGTYLPLDSCTCIITRNCVSCKQCSNEQTTFSSLIYRQDIVRQFIIYVINSKHLDCHFQILNRIPIYYLTTLIYIQPCPPNQRRFLNISLQPALKSWLAPYNIYDVTCIH